MSMACFALGIIRRFSLLVGRPGLLSDYFDCYFIFSHNSVQWLLLMTGHSQRTTGKRLLSGNRIALDLT